MDAVATIVPLDAFERRLVDGFQRDFPLDERPYARIAERLRATEEDVIEAVARRLADGVVSRVGAVFRPGAIGASTLAAMRVPPGRLAEVARAVARHGAVNHNYAREHDVNLWFVATAPDTALLDRALDEIERAAGCAVMRLPMLRDYWIDLGFDLHRSGDREAPARRVPPPVAPLALDERDRRLVVALEDGLAAAPRPYDDLARRAGVAPAFARVRLAAWLNRGVIARFGLIVRHRPLGYTANAMCVWDVPDERADALGASLAREASVTLAYRRRRAEGWRYNLYAMIHGRDRAVVTSRRDAIATALGLDAFPHAVLFSTTAYKQRGARYVSRTERTRGARTPARPRKASGRSRTHVMSALADPIDRAVVNALQADFPLCERPFAVAAERLGLAEDDLIARIDRLAGRRHADALRTAVRRRADGRRLYAGGDGRPAGEVDRVAAIVNGFPEVAHNYLRDHALNLWFVVAARDARGDRRRRRAHRAGHRPAGPRVPEGTRVLRRRCCSAHERFGPRRPPGCRDRPRDAGGPPARGAALPRRRRIARRRAARSCSSACARCSRAGVIRRIGAVPNHYRLGWTGQRHERVGRRRRAGRRAGREGGRAPRGRSATATVARAGCRGGATTCSRWCTGATAPRSRRRSPASRTLLGDAARAHDVLYSTRILKKTGLRLA